jgi:hypothetical protein
MCGSSCPQLWLKCCEPSIPTITLPTAAATTPTTATFATTPAVASITPPTAAWSALTTATIWSTLAPTASSSHCLAHGVLSCPPSRCMLLLPCGSPLVLLLHGPSLLFPPHGLAQQVLPAAFIDPPMLLPSTSRWPCLICWHTRAATPVNPPMLSLLSTS